MTNKQIIIDGVDVSGCKHFSVHSCNGCCAYFLENEDTVVGCKKYPNCNYKNWKRKEQECEELRGVIRKDICSHYVLGECSQKHHNNCVGRNQCIKDLEQQLDQLKAELEAYKMEAEEGKEINAELKAENEELKKIIKRLDVPKHEVIDMDIALENEKLKAENEDLKKSILQVCPNCGEEYLNYKGVELYYENNDLKQTLTEIKEIAENGKRFAERYMITGEQKANVLTYANAILNKISEVVDEEISYKTN